MDGINGCKEYLESNKVNSQKSLGISLAVLVFITTVVGFFVSLTDGFTIINGIIMGGILFICGLFRIVYIHNLRTKRKDDNNEE
ncbi:hypothetical protein [Oceanobacillus chungangensis]|uniref:Uncharacterized protein n=1 Tax=Oceanobacillus chungangensis TaxID=1229152 RepID=A0A3D8PW02_9BACI|nr:hypothetical protein [Oceanobacillus chungangensis]RDW19942.1 hypothetical protein CWR45_07730 [Oceanobacillus chungangensis]